jgi:hypothetical protein
MDEFRRFRQMFESFLQQDGINEIHLVPQNVCFFGRFSTAQLPSVLSAERDKKLLKRIGIEGLQWFGHNIIQLKKYTPPGATDLQVITHHDGRHFENLFYILI